MSGRGRGRGGGPGAARNKALAEQLGLEKSDFVKGRMLAPPETFPSLQFRAPKMTEQLGLDRSYMLVVKKQLREHLQNSEYNIVADSLKPDIERYSDRFHCLNNKSQLSLCWDRFPKELRPKKETAVNGQNGIVKRKKVPKPNVAKKRKTKETFSVEEKLNELEKKESHGDEEKEEKVEEETEEGREAHEEEEHDVDEEMDDDTDYINSYFDNGENYIDDDGDDMDEGGVF